MAIEKRNLSTYYFLGQQVDAGKLSESVNVNKLGAGFIYLRNDGQKTVAKKFVKN
jgi:hypothetical protein